MNHKTIAQKALLKQINRLHISEIEKEELRELYSFVIMEKEEKQRELPRCEKL